MHADDKKSKAQLIRELQALRRVDAEGRRRLKPAPENVSARRKPGQQTAEALQMAQVIIDRSPVILFRRMAGDPPRLVYVSDNIKQFGYTADDFYSGKIAFREIVHPQDDVRVAEEIKAFTTRDVEEYTQYYRIVTRDGRTRWVEDQTTVSGMTRATRPITRVSSSISPNADRPKPNCAKARKSTAVSWRPPARDSC